MNIVQHKWFPRSHLRRRRLKSNGHLLQLLAFYKIKMDGAAFLNRKEAGVGVIIRDEEGRVIAALSKKIKAPITTNLSFF